ncbi:LTV-domain-containing protein [Pleurotus eryngii]|uniref:LTV-domain-containing protein n=1 Tax=Pleurotus eryngii TaxID=5323 RepID=A0A9P6DLB8_PLEER|nr:LTV-domain-containing protein [Pleurotus eryngii]
MPPKSIFRQPGARHFQLVHRSQRDPLYYDAEASKHVLKPIERENVIKKGKSRADLESTLAESDLAHDSETHVGEASLYGIYYDDTQYDYMQHLRPVGLQEDGVDSILIEAPRTSKVQSSKSNKNDNASIPIALRDLPKESLPSTSELPRNYESEEAVPFSISGFQPDMDPHLRQTLEALDDDAFVDDGLADDFFGELVGDGERAEDEEIDFSFEEEGVDETAEGHSQEGEGNEGWEARFAQFKKENKQRVCFGSDDGSASDDGDTVGKLPEFSVIGGKGKRRRKGTSEASGYSMSSSSMYRTETLQTLDEMFDQMVLKEYNENEEEDDRSESESESDSSATPELITSRTDFDAMMDDFLDNYEVLGRKAKPKLEGDTGAEKLNTLRQALGQDERVRITQTGDSDDDEDEEAILASFGKEEDTKQDRWDCETILSTYSNLENHPRLIRARDANPVVKIRLDPRTGFPMVEELPPRLRGKAAKQPPVEDDEDKDAAPVHYTVARPKDETPEEKRARKAAVKAEKQVRRADKKATKEQFAAEFKAQKRTINNKEKASVRKL